MYNYTCSTRIHLTSFKKKSNIISNMKLHAKGRWKITNDSIRIETSLDFCSYYLWLFMRGTYNLHKMQLPKHKAHILVISSKIHKVDCSPFLYLNDQVVWFNYSEGGNMGGFSNGFKNWWLDTDIPRANEILDFYGFKKQAGFSRTHITISNSKNL